MLARTAIALSAALGAAIVVPTSDAQDAYSLLNELYGRGVHAYFSGVYDQAQRLFDEAITHGSRDPRCYYFRGLTQLRLGQVQDAQQDFRAAAKLEFSAEGAYNVARSLERVQGPERLQLEQIRRETRLASMRRPRPGRSLTRTVTPPSGTADHDASDAVRPATADVPLPTEVESGPPANDASDPFAQDTSGPIGAERIEPASPPATEPVQDRAVTQTATEEDPFGSGAQAVAEPTDSAAGAANEDPFAGAPPSSPAGGRDATSSKGKVLGSLFRAVTGAIPGVSGSKSGQQTQGPPSGAGGATPPGPASPANDPFADTADAPDPFGDVGKSSDDPFAPPAKAASSAVPPPPTSVGGDAPGASDPFGDTAGPGDDPFGAPATTAPAAPKQAAGDSPARDAAGGAGSTPGQNNQDAADDQQTDPFADDPNNPF